MIALSKLPLVTPLPAIVCCDALELFAALVQISSSLSILPRSHAGSESPSECASSFAGMAFYVFALPLVAGAFEAESLCDYFGGLETQLQAIRAAGAKDQASPAGVAGRWVVLMALARYGPVDPDTKQSARNEKRNTPTVCALWKRSRVAKPNRERN